MSEGTFDYMTLHFEFWFNKDWLLRSYFLVFLPAGERGEKLLQNDTLKLFILGYIIRQYSYSKEFTLSENRRFKTSTVLANL